MLGTVGPSGTYLLDHSQDMGYSNLDQGGIGGVCAISPDGRTAQASDMAGLELTMW